MTTGSEARLIIEIKNNKPVELLDLSDSFQSLGRQYVRYLGKHNVKVSDEAKLYVNHIRTGSIIAELQDLVPFAVLFADAENFNNVIEFAKNIKAVYDYYTGKGDIPREELSEPDLKNYSNILKPIVRDNGAQMNFTGSFNNSAVVILNLNTLEANAAQNAINRELESKKESISGFHDKVVFYWHTLRNNQNSSTVEKGIIEAITNDAIKVVMEDATKNEMAFMQGRNPMLIGFIVDVQVQTIQGRPVLYKILRIHDTV